MIEGAVKDVQLNSEDWDVLQELIQGVYIKEVRHVPRDHGVITEMYRPGWDPTGLPIVHAYQSRLFPGAIGAWSCHERSIDRVFVNQGHVKLVLFDGRDGSPTQGRLNILHLGDVRPAFAILPTGVWHGVQNLGPSDALFINFPSLPYQYEDPDHYRLPWDTDKIPYDWDVSAHRKRSR
jgi:dTDP-4-dehydrorhamnose 3,5-epimerase